MRPLRSLLTTLVAPLALTAAIAGCGSSNDTSTSTTTTATGATASSAIDVDIETDTGPVTVRLGYFPNVTHAPAIVGVENGLFTDHLGDNKLETKTFNAGPEAVEALFAEALDITYIGPNPAINAYAKSKADGGAIRIISGSTSGGAALVVRPEIRTASDLKGRKVATPQLGNTQDVALRAWLKDQELTSDTSGGGDVSIVPQANADTLAAFKAGDIDGAWVPEPWVSRLVQEGNGTVLVDEADLWPDGQFVTTHIVVRTAFLEDHPDVVAAFLRGHLAALDAIETDPAAARTVTNTGIEKLTDKALPTEVIDSAWKNLTFTADPVASSLSKSARDAEQAGLLEPVELEGIYDLEVLNQLLASAGSAEVEGL